MSRVLTIILILIALLIAYRYYSNIEGFTTERALLNITTRIDTNDGYFDIFANTTNNTNIRGVKILYSSVTPVLAPGQSTDSSLSTDVGVISGTPFQILNKPVYTLKNNHKYYFVTSDVVKYTEGVTPLLGSFVFNGPVTPPPIRPPVFNGPVTPPAQPPVINGPVTPPAQPPVNPSSAVSGTSPIITAPLQPIGTPSSSASNTKSDLLQEIRSVIRSQLLSDMPSMGQTPTCPTCSQCSNACTC
jgi:hypothetical protein